MLHFVEIIRNSVNMTHLIDRIDSNLLDAVQKNAHLTAQELGEKLNLSASQAARRRLRLESEGIIKGYRAQLDPAKVGLGVQGFIQVQMASHRPKSGQAFRQMIAARPEIISAWAMTGEADCLLRVYCRDLVALNNLIHEVLLTHPSVARVHSQIVMDQMKLDAPLPT